MQLEAWTDGSGDVRPPKIGGWAVVITSPTNPFIYEELFGAVHETTSARMEMQGVIESLKWPRVKSSLRIHCDSAYVVNCIEDDWLTGWRKKGWMTSRDEPVKNQDLWEEMEELIKWHHAVRLLKVKGHSGDQYNELVDTLAGTARKEARARWE